MDPHYFYKFDLDPHYFQNSKATQYRAVEGRGRSQESQWGPDG
jgi:hypothetical protein